MICENAISKEFAIIGEIEKIEKIGSGHINETYRLYNTQKGNPDYLLQSINTNIFTNVEALTENIVNVTKHIRSKYTAAECITKVLTPVAALNGNYYFKDKEGKYWRMFTYIQDSLIYEIVSSKKIAYEAGRAFGTFQSQLADYPVEKINEVLPRFHDPIRRINEFKDAVKNNIANRNDRVRKEIDFAMNRSEEMMRIALLEKQGILKKRIAHYDTKCSNILFDKNENAMCVIDLDTVMPGFVINDFGDSIRTFANTATEDEVDLSKITIRLDIYEEYATGYLQATQSFLTEAERENLAFAAKYLTYEQGIRFLSDYLNGDTYYHIKSPQHNLQRTRSQFKFLSEMEKNYSSMEKIIFSLKK